MSQLYVYEPWPTAVDTMGLCGPLTPTKAVCTQEKNGDFRLDIEHPIDEAGKWAKLVPGNLIKADVPLRTTPIMKIDNGYATVLDIWRVKAGASRADREVMSAVPGSLGLAHAIRLDTLDAGAQVCVVRASSGPTMAPGYSEVVWTKGRGWILTAAIEFVASAYAPGTRAGIEAHIPSPRTRPQLFRIHSVSLTEKGIDVKARHVSYDYLGVLVSLAKADDVPLEVVMMSVMYSGWRGEIKRHVETRGWIEVNTAADIPGWAHVSSIEALLAPSNSVASIWNATIFRDNWTITALKTPTYDSGYKIEYGKNLLGVKFEVDTTDVISALLPVGQTSKGKPLTIPDGTYTVDSVATTVSDGIVRSVNDNYAVPHIGVLDLGSAVKAAGTTSTQLKAAYTKMIRATRKKFADEKCDLPSVTLNVDFLMLDDSEEYKQYRGLQKLFLYDTVRVKHPRLGIDVTTQVNKTVWDCLLDRYDSIELGSVRRNYARSKLAGWQIPGLDSLKSYVNTISGLV